VHENIYLQKNIEKMPRSHVEGVYGFPWMVQESSDPTIANKTTAARKQGATNNQKHKILSISLET
jgi:hypothetical protein